MYVIVIIKAQGVWPPENPSWFNTLNAKVNMSQSSGTGAGNANKDISKDAQGININILIIN